jgi:hypothetical protein
MIGMLGMLGMLGGYGKYAYWGARLSLILLLTMHEEIQGLDPS